MTAPSPGQLVTVRQRQWVVTDVRESSLPQGALERLADTEPQNLVDLSSIEDDALGEELRVIWEIEPGTRIFDQASLPDPREGMDDPARLDAFLDAVRWGAVGGASVRHLHSPFTSGITIEDYQLDPVVRALQMPRVNLLIADDVGLGKTIEAGLVAQELILRHRVRTIMVVCPAGLQLQWRDQMRDKFGLEFRIVDSDCMKDLRRRRGIHVNPWNHHPRLITSIDFLKQDRVLRRFTELLPRRGEPAFPRRFDLLIVDEAHNVAPSGRGNYAIDSLRTQAIREIARHFEHKLFLTATPHNGYTESFSALLELLDDQRFARGMVPDEAQKEAVMVRRLKRELPPDDLGRARFPDRDVVPLPVPYTEDEQEAHRKLRRYADLRHKSAASDGEAFATDFVLKLLKKRLFSSPEAFHLTLEKHEETVRGRRPKPDARAVTIKHLRKTVSDAEEESADDDLFEERLGEAVGTTSNVLRELSPEEGLVLDEMKAWARRAAAREDSKAKVLLDWLNRTLRSDGKWNGERAIIFTEYRATQNWLHGILAQHGLTEGGRLLTLYGGMKLEDREKVKAAFQAAPEVSEVRILLGTDAASEGIDLQNHCSRLVHYEIPWNPNRLEQRNGRIDRHGQKAAKVDIHHFVAEGFRSDLDRPFRTPGELDGDLEFLMRAVLKVEQIREDLGSTGDVIATQVEEAMLGRRTNFDPDADSPRARVARGALKFERKIRERTREIRDQLSETKAELNLSPENVKSCVDVGLELARFPPLRPAEVAAESGRKIAAWKVPQLPGAWGRASVGLAHPHTGEVRPVVFDADAAAGRDDLVLAHLGHPLVAMCLSLLRREIWQPKDRRNLHRVAAKTVPSSLLDHPTVIGHARLVVLGSDNVRLHEELITAGGILREGRYRRLDRVGDIQTALEAGRQGEPAPESLRAELAGTWEDHRESLLRSLEARMKERTSGLMGTLTRRAGEEAGKLAKILSELRELILKEAHRKPAQLELFTSLEEDQFNRNKSALLARAEEIPAEIERETERLLSRYKDPTPRLFPVAVTYLVPGRLSRG